MGFRDKWDIQIIIIDYSLTCHCTPVEAYVTYAPVEEFATGDPGYF